MKSWNLNFLEPSRPLQACNGTALLIYMHTHTHTHTHKNREILNFKVVSYVEPQYKSWGVSRFESVSRIVQGLRRVQKTAKK